MYETISMKQYNSNYISIAMLGLASSTQDSRGSWWVATEVTDTAAMEESTGGADQTQTWGKYLTCTNCNQDSIIKMQCAYMGYYT